MKKDLRNYLLAECFTMVKHLSAEGKTIPSNASPLLNMEEADCCEIDISEQEVLKLHNVLSKKIAPALPKTIWLLYQESKHKKGLRFLGPVVLIRRLMLVALISLICFIIITTSPAINFENIKQGIYTLDGLNLLFILFFYLISASLGASFSNLFMANRYIVRNTFDPKYESSYWIRFILGIIAGIMLAVIIPMPKVDSNTSVHAAVASRPMLAMLGGFSAALVYRILFRLVNAVESIFVGSESDVSEQKINNLKEAHEMDKENERQKMINELTAIQGEVNLGKPADELKSIIQNSISKLRD